MTSNDKVPPTATLDFKPTLVSTAEHASNFAQKCDPTHEPELASVSIPMSISVPALESFSLSKIEPLSVSALESSLVPVSVISQYNRLDEADLQEAKKLGLLLENLPVNLDATAADFGIAYEKRGGTKIAGCAIDVLKAKSYYKSDVSNLPCSVVSSCLYPVAVHDPMAAEMSSIAVKSSMASNFLTPTLPRTNCNVRSTSMATVRTRIGRSHALVSFTIIISLLAGELGLHRHSIRSLSLLRQQ
ncbi:hypothetical protein Plhal710r2_c081g0180061 [Plasmopara halstedii]